MQHTLFGALVLIGFWLSLIGAWLTHVIWIIQTLSSEIGATMGQAVLGGIGAFMPPIGVIHGFMIWFGAGL